jgi:hypothetical protein
MGIGDMDAEKEKGSSYLRPVMMKSVGGWDRSGVCYVRWRWPNVELRLKRVVMTVG